MFSSHRIKEEPSNDIQFPLLDENSEVNEAEQLLNIESECLLNSLKKASTICCIDKETYYLTEILIFWAV